MCARPPTPRVPSTSLDAEVVVIGAGVVGLAVAARLARRLSGVVVVESERTFGLGISSRSSEVVHAGLYYEPGSLKARLCVEGAERLRKRCERLGVGLLERGKIVLACQDAELPALERLAARAEANGARGLVALSRDELPRFEPRLAGAGALFVPQTAVVDSHELMRTLHVEALSLGAHFAFRHEVVALEQGDRWKVILEDPNSEHLEVHAPWVVNAAGLGAEQVAALAGVEVTEARYVTHPCKGDYFSLRKGALRGLERLVYPLPEKDGTGLGVHLTVDVGGSARLGPDTEYVSLPLDFAVSESKLGAFLEAGKRLLAWLEADDLAPERSGIRPKLTLGDEEPRDFVIRHETDRGLEGLIDLIGIESPGLSASLAIAAKVEELLHLGGAGLR